MEKLQAYNRLLRKRRRSCSPVAVAAAEEEEPEVVAVPAEEVVENPAAAVKARAAWAVVPVAPGKAVMAAAREEAKDMAPNMEWDKVMELGPKHSPEITIKHVIELTKATKTVSKNLL